MCWNRFYVGKGSSALLSCQISHMQYLFSNFVMLKHKKWKTFSKTTGRGFYFRTKQTTTPAFFPELFFQIRIEATSMDCLQVALGMYHNWDWKLCRKCLNHINDSPGREAIRSSKALLICDSMVNWTNPTYFAPG